MAVKLAVWLVERMAAELVWMMVVEKVDQRVEMTVFPWVVSRVFP